MKIILITESQYKRIFLDEQVPPRNNFELQPSDRLGPSGSFQPLKHLKVTAYGKRHDSYCNDKWRQYCSKKGMIATNTTKKGKEWDILSGRAERLSNGEYSTWGWGETDNEDVTKCRCQRGKVTSTPRKASSYNSETDSFETVTVYDTNFIPQGATISQWDGKERSHAEQMRDLRLYNKEISSLRDKTGVEKFIYDYRHEIIDVLAVAALFIPVPGLNVAVSMGLEGLNAAMYVAEGDNTSGFLSVIFMAIPGIGPLARRITQKGVNKVYKIYKTARTMKNSGKSADDVAKYMAEQSKKLTPDEQKFLKEINKPENIKKIQQSGKELESLTQSGTHFKPKDVLDNAFGKDSDVYNQFLKYQTGFGKNSKFLKELMNPTKLEKYIFAGTVLGMMTLDKSGLMSIATDKFLKLLVDLGLKNPGISQKDVVNTKNRVEQEINQAVFDYINNKGSISIKDREQLTLPSDVKEKIYKKVDKTIKTSIEVMNTIPNKKLITKVLELPTDKQQKIVNKLNKEGIKYNTELRNFRNYKWSNYCKNRDSKFNISIPNININDEKVDWLGDRSLNYRYIKSPKLGNQYEYASDEDGLWFYKKTGSDEWKLVVNCGALLRIETELEKLNDKDLDTEGELIDYMKLYGIDGL